ncbi:hypothetical protein SALBM311S_11068 [Streptomyces alboniger]
MSTDAGAGRGERMGAIGGERGVQGLQAGWRDRRDPRGWGTGGIGAIGGQGVGVVSGAVEGEGWGAGVGPSRRWSSGGADAVAPVSGAGLAAGLDRLEGALRADRDQRADLRAQLAGARSTAVMLAGLPALGLLLGTALGADPLHVLLHTGLGLGCLLVGAVLEGLGMWWATRWSEERRRHECGSCPQAGGSCGDGARTRLAGAVGGHGAARAEGTAAAGGGVVRR